MQAIQGDFKKNGDRFPDLVALSIDRMRVNNKRPEMEIFR